MPDLGTVQISIDELNAGLSQIIHESLGEGIKSVEYEIHGNPQDGFTLAVTILHLRNGKRVDSGAPRKPDRAMRELLSPDGHIYSFLSDNNFTEVFSPTGAAYTIRQA